MSTTIDAREQEVEVVFLEGEETLGLNLGENTNGLLSIKTVEPGIYMYVHSLCYLTAL